VSAKPRIGLVLGGGGARGLAHIVVLETFDRLGIRPVEIAGTSIGAVIGSAYASGLSGKALRAHTLNAFKNRADVISRFFQARTARLSDLWRGGFTNPIQVDPQVILDTFMPRPLPERFEDLLIPLHIVAADLHRLERVVYSSGPLKLPVCASMAIPGVAKPVQFDGRVLVDGGTVDPLPIRAITADVDLVLAVDVSRSAPRDESEKIPGAVELGFRVYDLMQSALADAQTPANGATLHRIKAPVSGYNALDFFSARKIFAASESLALEVEAVIKAVSPSSPPLA